MYLLGESSVVAEIKRLQEALDYIANIPEKYQQFGLETFDLLRESNRHITLPSTLEEALVAETLRVIMEKM